MEEQLSVANINDIKAEMGTVQVEDETKKQLDAEAASFVDKLLSGYSENNIEGQQLKISSIELLGSKTQKAAQSMNSVMLQRPIKDLIERASQGGDIANALVDLTMKIDKIDPNKINFGEKGWLNRLIGKFSRTLRKYLMQYQQTQVVINEIITSLKNSTGQLMRNNGILKDDQVEMRKMSIRLTKMVELAQAVDRKMDEKVETDIPSDDPRYKFIKEELLYPLRQKIMDLQQLLAVNQQGILTFEIIIRNNKELIRGVNRAINVTVPALQVGVSAALALNDQQKTLDKMDAVNETTSNLLAGTAQRLKEQGADIHKRASSSMLNIEKLKSAFSDIKAAMEDIATFRNDALPKMAQTILEFDSMAKEGEKIIANLEKGNKSQNTFSLDIEE